LRTITYRKKKFITSKKSDGNIVYYTDVNIFNISKLFNKFYDPEKQNFLLFRTNRLRQEVANYLFENTDIIFGFLNSEFGQKWSQKFISISNSLNKLNQQKPLTNTELFYLFSTLPAKTCLVYGIKKKIANDEKTKTYSFEEVLNMLKLWKPQKDLLTFDKDKNLFYKKLKEKILRYIQYYKNPKDKESLIKKNEIYRKKLENINKIISFSFSEENKIIYNTQLGTYHSSKGLEADNVFVFLGTSENFRTIDDSERRCFYVACSRTKENLIFINSLEEDKAYLENEFSILILSSKKTSFHPSQTKIDNLDKITQILEEMHNKSDILFLLDIFEEVKKQTKMEEPEIEEIINLLKKKGNLFEPKPGFIKLLN